jgi:hypothetical protein
MADAIKQYPTALLGLVSSHILVADTGCSRNAPTRSTGSWSTGCDPCPKNPTAAEQQAVGHDVTWTRVRA